MSGMRPTIIAPSILASNFARLADECRAVLDAGADWLHVDVMDGHYVPNLTIGLPVVEALRAEFPDVTLDVHLMISNPDDYVVKFVEAGADWVSFHPEVSHHPHRALQAIRGAGGKASLAINPGTPLHWLDHLVDDVDMVLVMSVNPGFGGQGFIEGTLPKLRQLDQRLRDAERRDDVFVQVDGGVGPKNVAAIAEAGANVFVAGSAIFKAESYAGAIRAMREAVGS